MPDSHAGGDGRSSAVLVQLLLEPGLGALVLLSVPARALVLALAVLLGLEWQMLHGWDRSPQHPHGDRLPSMATDAPQRATIVIGNWILALGGVP
jgi:hypothetical protein